MLTTFFADNIVSPLLLGAMRDGKKERAEEEKERVLTERTK